MNIWEVALIVFLLNIPFGYWRANTTRLSMKWFLSVHIPVPLVIALRFISGLGWQLITFPILIGAFFAGQYLGSKLHLWWRGHAKGQLTSCLVWDVVRDLQSR